MNQHNIIKSSYFDASGEAHALLDNIEKAQADGAKALLILACDDNGFTPELLDSGLKNISIPICGGIFPQLIENKQHHERGSLVCGLKQAIDICHVPLADFDLNSHFECDWLPQAQSIVVLVDGLSARIDPLIESLYNQVGPDVSVCGSGAGSLSFQQKPCLFSNQGLLMETAQIINFSYTLEIGVRHGWQQLAGPFLVTHAEDHVIHSLNYQPAYQVYRETVEPIAGQNFADTDFFNIAKRFPFGMDKVGEELLVRDPIRVDGESLVCVGRVAENAMIHILQGEQEQLVAAAGEAAQKVTSAKDNGTQSAALVFDCISRVLFLEEHFHQELEQIQQALPEQTPILGALTLGEIASSEKGGIQFLNKTTVIGLIKQ